MARRTRLTPQVHNDLLEAINAGARYEDAAAYAGVSPSAFYSWLAKGRQAHERLGDNDPAPTDPDRPFVELLEAVTRANGALAVFAAGHWRLAIAGGDYRASRDFLHARFPHWRHAEDADPGALSAGAGGPEALVPAQAQAVAAAIDAVLNGLDLSPAQRDKAPGLARAALLGLPMGDGPEPDEPPGPVVEAKAKAKPKKRAPRKKPPA